MTHTDFVASWEEFGERFLLADKELVGSPEAWFKVCTGPRWWDDDRLPPEQPVRPSVMRRPPRKRRVQSPPRKVSVRLLSQIGRDLTEWSGPEDHSSPARHREREKEFREKVARELESLREWLEGDEWPQAA